MKKHVILITLVLCFVSSISQAQGNSFSLDRMQEVLFGVSTLKGVKEVYPQVQIEFIELTATEITSTSKIESLERKDLEEQIIQALKKEGIKIAENYDPTSPDAPLSLNVTVFIKETISSVHAQNNYNTYIYTEAFQPIILSRDNSIRSLSRTWPMTAMGLFNRNMLVLDSQTLEKEVKDEIGRQVDFFIRDFIKANPNTARRNAEGVNIAELRKTLLVDNTEIRYGAIKNNDPSLQAIQKLESVGSEETVNVLLEFLTNNRMDRKLKQHALTALGKIGTEPAIEAIKKFETWSQKRFSEPQPFYMGFQEHAIDHYAPSDVQPLAQAKDRDNKTWALVPLSRYGSLDLWLTSLLENNVWSEPVFLSLHDFPGLSMSRRERENANSKLQVEGDVLKITYNDTTYETRISDQLKDTDKDGLPDFVETRLQTDPKNPDSDGDSVLDGKDSNPFTPKHKGDKGSGFGFCGHRFFSFDFLLLFLILP